MAWLALSLSVALNITAADAAGRESQPNLSDAAWIWSSRQALVDSTDVCAFRRKLVLASKPREATVVLTADNSYDLYVNGHFIAGDGGMEGSVWRSVERYRIDAHLLEGPNVIAIRGENLGGPGGLIATLTITFPDGDVTTVTTDTSWLVSSRLVPGWTESDHDDSLWGRAVILGRLGIAPWGDLAVPDGVSIPRRRAGAPDVFTEATDDFSWPAGVVFLSGKAPLDSDPGAPQSKWPIHGSKAFFEHDTPSPAALGYRLHALVPARPDVRPRLLLDAGEGRIGSPVGSFDGREVIFSYVPEGEKYFKIFRVAADGTGLRRLTSGPWHDYDPAPLPDGRIVFASTRIGSRDEYHANTARSLFCLSADRQAVWPITHHIVGDSSPVLMSDGRLAFVRSDNFMERAKVETHIHVCNPDGSGADVLVGPDRLAVGYDRPTAAEDPAQWLRNLGFGNPAPLPGGVLACMSHAGPILYGPGIAGKAPLKTDVSLFDFAPLPDGRLLCSTKQSGALAVLDPSTGRATALSRAEGVDLHSIAFLGERPRPPLPPSRVKPPDRPHEQRVGSLLCLDVFDSKQTAADWQRVEAVRIFMGEPMTTRAARHPYGHIGTEGIELGTIPLAPDGSFHARVPADRALAVQAVDAEGRSVVNELSWIYVRPGETRSCSGCHDRRGRTPGGRSALATRVEPVDLLPGSLSHRFRANNAANGGVLNLQFDRFREAASIDLYTQSVVPRGYDTTQIPPGRASEVARLARRLAAGDASARTGAAQRLGIIRDRLAVPPLVRALQDPERSVRLAAALSLASCGDRRAVEPLLDALGDSRPLVARACHLALEHLTREQGEFDAFAPLSERLDQAARWKARLLSRSWEQIEKDLVSKLSAQDPVRLQLVIESLGHVGAAVGATALVELLRSSTDHGLTTELAAIRALGHLGDASAVPVLAAILETNSGATGIRPRKSHEFGWAQRPVQLAAAAAEALGWIGTSEAEARLIAAFGRLAPFWEYTYQNGDHEWLKGCHSSLPHYRIAEALDALGSRDAAPIVAPLLRSVPMDPDRGLLYENDSYETIVSRVIHRSGEAPAVIDACLALLGDDGASAPKELLDAVSASPPAVSVGVLTPEARAAHILSVVSLQPEVAPRARRILESYWRQEPSRRRSWVCFFTARTLGKLRDPASVDVLLHILETDPPEASHGVPDPPSVFLHEAMTPLYRAAVADALGRIGAREAVSVLFEIIEDFDNAMEVRQAAAWALGRVATPAVAARLERLASRYPEVATGRTLQRAFDELQRRAAGP